MLEIARAGEINVIASGLNFPTGVAVADDGACYVTETGAHRVVRVDGGIENVMDGLDQPQGITMLGDTIVVVDAGSRQLLAISRADRRRQVLASNLPVGAAGASRSNRYPESPGFFPDPSYPSPASLLERTAGSI